MLIPTTAIAAPGGNGNGNGGNGGNGNGGNGGNGGGSNEPAVISASVDDCATAVITITSEELDDGSPALPLVEVVVTSDSGDDSIKQPFNGNNLLTYDVDPASYPGLTMLAVTAGSRGSTAQTVVYDDVFNSSCDPDGDGVYNPGDNCPDTANSGQHDLDNDGIGNHCDSDADGDTYHRALWGGDDCNDFNAAINPGATEIVNNNIDEDCDRSDLVDPNGPKITFEVFADSDADGVFDPDENLWSEAGPIPGDFIYFIRAWLDNNSNGVVDAGDFDLGLVSDWNPPSGDYIFEILGLENLEDETTYVLADPEDGICATPDEGGATQTASHVQDGYTTVQFGLELCEGFAI